MSADERQKLRADKLEELYDYHHENGGRERKIRNEYIDDPEAGRAYDYLDGHGLAILKKNEDAQGYISDVRIKISSRGVDEVESNRVK